MALSSNPENMQSLFPRCPICKSEEGYEFSPFYPNIQCSSCKSEWALYEFGMELKFTSQAGWIRRLLNKKFSFEFWEKLKEPAEPQISHRIFAPMDCVGSAPEHLAPSKGYVLFESTNELVYVGTKKDLCWPKKEEARIPIKGIKDATIRIKEKIDWANVLVFGLAGAILFPEKKKFLVLTYEDPYGMLHHRIFDFHEDEESIKEFINLLKHLKAKT